KDYYAILGVLPSAELVVIRAAYRALAMQYHPDKWKGDKATAELRMRQLNEAHEVLSDERLRRQYDSIRPKQPFEKYEFENDAAQDAFRDAEKFRRSDWEVATEYYPDLNEMYSELRKTSVKLAFAFQTTMLETKRFSERREIASNFEEIFLRTYFGKNPKVLDFARNLIDGGHKAAAKELNRAISVLGDDIDDRILVGRIQSKYFKENLSELYKVSLRKMADSLLQNQYVNDAIALIEKVGGTVSQQRKQGRLFAKDEIVVEVFGESHNFEREYDMTQWVIKTVVPRIVQ
ncbi:MAG: hypothetical protein JWR80_3517, partial [Bradyrhizobium sp.]|nr:hypothetical protein [Bradyrhizobium sp.]